MLLPVSTRQHFTEQAPDLAAAVRARFEATLHHVLATVRRDGSPRVSDTEVYWHGPDLVVGSMPARAEARDLQRDGRLALHANLGDGSMTGGDVKLSARAVEIVDPDQRRVYGRLTKAPAESHLESARIGRSERAVKQAAPAASRHSRNRHQARPIGFSDVASRGQRLGP